MVTTTATEKTTITTVEHGEHCSRHIGFIHLAEPDRNICTYNRPLSGEEREREGDGRSGREGRSEGAALSVGLTNSAAAVEAAPPPSAHASVAPVDHGGTASHGNSTSPR